MKIYPYPHTFLLTYTVTNTPQNGNPYNYMESLMVDFFS